MTPDRASLRVRLILQHGECACCGEPIDYHKGPTPAESGPLRYTVLTSGEIVCEHGCVPKTEVKTAA